MDWLEKGPVEPPSSSGTCAKEHSKVIQQESSRDWWGHRSSIDLEVETLVGLGLAERSG